MLATSIYIVVFRVLHVLPAIAWAGTVFLLVFFLQPTAKAIGLAAGPFMRELLGTRRLVDWILRIAGATVVAGGLLYWHDVQVFGGLGDFLGSAFGVRDVDYSVLVGPLPRRLVVMTTVYDLSLDELTGRLGAWGTLRRLGGPGNSEANL